MNSKIKKCSRFLIDTEFNRINKRIKLLTENLQNDEKNSKNKNLNIKQEIIKNTTNSIETINKITDEKKKEVLDSHRLKKIKAQSQEELDNYDNQVSDFLNDIDLEGEKKAADIVWEIIPKKSDTKEVSAEKIETTYSVFDYLSKNAKKFLLVTCIGLLGWNSASNLFSQKDEAKKILDEVKKAGVNIKNTKKFVVPPIINWEELGAGGSIGETPNEEKGQKLEPEPIYSKEILKQLSDRTNELKKKYDVKNPSSLKVGQYFDASQTVFTSCNFPFPINYNSTSSKFLKNENSVDIIGKYLKELDEFAKDKKTGLKLLALSMTVMEGYKKNTKVGPTDSYTTNNPGNIDNTDSGHKNYYKTLKDGIADQLAYLESAAKGNKLYPIGKVKSEPPYKSRQLGRYTPGFVFIYEGTLEQFVKIYATGPRLDNNYMNLILTFFRTYLPEANVTPKTKIIDIINSGGTGRLIDLLEIYNPGIKKAIAVQMVKGHKKSISDVIAYTGLTAEELKELNLMPETSKTKKKKK